VITILLSSHPYKRLRFFGALVALATSLGASAGEIITSTPSAPVIEQYARIDVDITLKAKWSNPFRANDVAVDVIFQAPSGKQLRLPAFFVEGKTREPSHWQARFTPQEAGSYSYQIVLAETDHWQKPATGGQFSVAPSTNKGFLHPHSNWEFRFDNGDFFRGIGENFCWEHRDKDDSKFFQALHENPRFNYETMLPKLSSQGANFIRTWMIYWNLPVDWQWVDNASRYQPDKARFNASGIARMDKLVELAEQNHMYLMLAMDPQVALLGEGWDKSIYNKKNGGSAATPAEFFSSPQARAAYKDKLRFMVARWGYSTSIAAWEFFNEVDNVTYADATARIPDAPVVDWHRDMSQYLAQVDPYDHMITTSISHRDLAGLNDIPDISFNQKHIYKATGAIPQAIRDYTIKHHKPYVVGEAGFEWDWSKNFNEFADDMTYDFKRGLWYGIFSPTPVVPLSWWWEFFDEKNTTAYFQSVKDIDLMMRQAGKGQLAEVDVRGDNDKVEHYAVKAGDHYFVYLNNLDQTSQTIKLTIADRAMTAPQIYDPETRRFYSASTHPHSGSSGITLKAREQLILVSSAVGGEKAL
jgi:hypothetical protein